MEMAPPIARVVAEANTSPGVGNELAIVEVWEEVTSVFRR